MKRAISLSLCFVGVVLFAADVASAGSSGAKAAVSLLNAQAALSQHTNTAWTLKKTGAVDSNASTVTWTITATQGATTSGPLTVDGFMTLYNSGAKAATIGNIVVNLQVKSGSSWKTESSDIADATHGDAATHAYIDPHASSENLSQFSTNSGSGKVDFMDAVDNSVFSLTPEKTIAPGASVNLLFAATFDNGVLKLSDGSSVRAEVIVSFGNSTSTPPSAQNVDINGNGVIDPDEAWVRSIPARITMTVPSATTANSSPTLTDTTSDLATTGTVTYSNPQFNLGASSGTVTVTYNGGTSGGKITNCAHLKSPDLTVTVGGYTFTIVAGVNLQACDTETIAANAITAGWQDGQMLTYNQSEWGIDTGGTVLVNNFNIIYGSTTGAFIIGDPSIFYAEFTSATALESYLPQTGTVGVLTGILSNPTSSSSGGFGGDVAALQLNVDFSDAGAVAGSASLKFGDLLLCNLTTATGLNGNTVRQVLATANTELGGGSTSFSASDLDSVAVQLNNSFESGNPSTFAQQHLFNGACPVWNNGDMLTYNQTAWGGQGASGTTAESLLTTDYDTIYMASSFVFTIGSTSGFTEAFSSATTLEAYVPQSGAGGVLTASLVDPTSSSSGTFGGDVAALQLNVDFSDNGFLAGTASLKFGDLLICKLTSDTGLNGSTVRQFLTTANTELGGGSTSFSAADLDTLAQELNNAFAAGIPSTFAQQNLRNGACP